MSFSAGAIVGDLTLNTDPFAKGILKAQSIARLFPDTVQNFLANPLLGLIGIAKSAGDFISGAFREIGHAADDAGEAAEKAGVSVKFLTTVGQVAADSGIDVMGFGDALKFLNRSAGEAAIGNQQFAAEFLRLGVNIRDASGHIKNTEQLFYDTADAIKAIHDPAEKTRIAMALLGRSGTEMLPTMDKGSDEIKRFAATIDQLGAGIDDKLAAAGDKFGTLTTIVHAAMTGIKTAVAEPILVGLEHHFDEVVEGIKLSSQIIRDLITDLFDGIRRSFHIPPSTAVLDHLRELAGWVHAHGNEIAGDVQAAIGAILNALAKLAPMLDFVKAHWEALAIALGALAVAATVSSISSLTGAIAGPAGLIPALALLNQWYNTVGRTAAGTKLTPGSVINQVLGTATLRSSDHVNLADLSPAIARKQAAAKDLLAQYQKEDALNASAEIPSRRELLLRGGGLLPQTLPPPTGATAISALASPPASPSASSFNASATTATQAEVSTKSLTLSQTLLDRTVNVLRNDLDLLDRQVNDLIDDLAALADSAQGIGGAGGGAGGAQQPGASATTVTIQQLNVPPFDVGEASSQVAKKIMPLLDQQVRIQNQRFVAAAGAARIAGGYSVG